jgi:hypothetical protein
MTEAEWLACTDPWAMLAYLRGKASDRKLRLFACAYCRLHWDLLDDGRSREAVEVAERYADGLAAEHEREAAAAAALAAASEAGLPLAAAYAATSAWYTVSYKAAAAAFTTCDGDAVEWYAENGIMMPHPRLLREIFGDPLRPVAINPTWLRWGDGAVVKLAGLIYEGRAFARAPALAEALEDAGCRDVGLLGHLSGPGEHVRGCWALDYILGKD